MMKLISIGLAAFVIQGLQSPQPTTGPRELVFNWPVGIEATVETERSRERTGTVNVPPKPVKAVQRMRVLPHPDGRLIRFEMTDKSLGGSSAENAKVLEALQGILPSFVVSPAGDLIKIEQLAELRATIHAALTASAREAG